MQLAAAKLAGMLPEPVFGPRRRGYLSFVSALLLAVASFSRSFQKYVMRVTPLAAGLVAGAALLAGACTSLKPTTFNAVPDTGPRTATVAFYNLENLFDTQDDPAINDQDFLPTSALKWDDARYRTKLTQMASVIEQLGSPNGPDVLGVSEVENRKVLQDLVAQPALASRKYQVIHFDSPDPRGIDVALIYKPDRFQPTSQRAVPLPLPDTTMGTRDVLLVSGKLNGESITFMVNHWPSRRSGSVSVRRRYAAADLVRGLVDAELQVNPQARILLMGDFNDYPTDSSITQHLRASYDAKNLPNGQLFNALYDAHQRGEGTHFYRQKGTVLDQMMLSPGLMGNDGLHFIGTGNIYKPARLLSTEEKYRGEPLRTYGGKKYLGGFSDHLPVYLTLTK